MLTSCEKVTGVASKNDSPHANTGCGLLYRSYLCVLLRLWYPEPQLRIQIDVVIPGRPVSHVQQAVRQCQHLGEAGIDVVDFVDHTFRNNDVPIAHNLHQTVANTRERRSYALVGRHVEGTALHLLPTNENLDRNRGIGRIANPQIRTQIDVVVPG